MLSLSGTKTPAKIAATGGAAKSSFWLKVCSETLNTEVFAAECIEPACKAAAMIG